VQFIFFIWCTDFVNLLYLSAFIILFLGSFNCHFILSLVLSLLIFCLVSFTINLLLKYSSCGWKPWFNNIHILEFKLSHWKILKQSLNFLSIWFDLSTIVDPPNGSNEGYSKNQHSFGQFILHPATNVSKTVLFRFIK
jgi:hypothetical protein